MALPKHKLISFPLADTKNGQLCMFQSSKSKADCVPFPIAKVLSITGMKDTDKRGGHTHHLTHQVLICTAGECIVDLDDGKNKTSITLNKPNEGLLLYPYVWHVMHSFKPGTSLLAMADREYDETEYIRNYEDFIKLTKNVQK